MGFVDLSQKGLLLADTKCCVDCKTTKTPLWRGGPTGPKEIFISSIKQTSLPIWGFLQSLCNACGIRFRKRKIFTRRTNRGGRDKKRERVRDNHSSTVAIVSATTTSSSGTTTTTTTTSGVDGDENSGECGSSRMKIMMGLEEDVMVVKKHRWQWQRKVGEEEKQAAVSLMALSNGSLIS
ncbi:GATA transcription factor 16-like [Cucumis melo var. makuwa]|uniref:GATA transcription factor 16-like n=1 Tax=Cucumis melo var. makuwa TaxID=1194695 RepID=A0A5D3CE96_CUCMM|nr:GATA transcription factor 16-like [Cucumis melo var. makuwa]